MPKVLTAAAAALICVALAGAADEPAASPTSNPSASQSASQKAQKELAVASAAEPSLVRVEYTLQYDKGECPLEELVAEERPLEAEGFLLADDTVLTDDVGLNPRFIKAIHVRKDSQIVEAHPSHYATQSQGYYLHLDKPLPGAKPLQFDASAKGPLFEVSYTLVDGRWTVGATSLSLTAAVRVEPMTMRLNERKITTSATLSLFACHAKVLVMNEHGTPVGVLMNETAPADESWKGSPLDWPRTDAKAMAQSLASAEAQADKYLLRVALGFRSPRKGAAESHLTGLDSEDSSSTEINATGVLINPQTVLVLANFNPKTTARLERITVHGVKDEAVAAKFAATLADYGAFTVTLDKPIAATAPVDVLSADNLEQLQNALLLSAEVIIQGEKRVAYYDYGRITNFKRGWKNRLYPDTRLTERFYFEPAGKLVILPVSRREKVAVQSGHSSTSHAIDTACSDLQAALGDLAANTDPQNIPLTEEQESRLAWLGVELQPLDRELARACNVSDLTADGASGAVVSYVYENSPAAAQGLKAGDILLRLQVEGQPKPVDVKGDNPNFGGTFPWDRLDELPEQYYDRVPTPWNAAENAFTRTLTDLGFGKKFTAEIFRDGKTLTKSFTVTEGPQHFMSAASYKSTAMGVTLRDMTYEVRRYFQKKPDDPGVVVAIITPGSKASVAGLKPFEVITHVDDQPVKDVKDFEKLIKDKTELRLSVNRMQNGRTVKIRMTGPTSAPAQAPTGGKKPPFVEEE